MSLLREDYQKFKANINQLMSGTKFPLQISEVEQNEYLDSIKPLVNNERFSFVVDLTSLELKNCMGVERWLGYATQQFSLFDYIKAIHPNYVNPLMQMALAALEVTNRNTGIFKFLDQRMIVCQPIREKNKKYWWVKRETTPFQFDAQGRMTSYVNLFTLVKEYEGESLAPRYMDLAGNRNSELYELFLERYREMILKNLPFTKREMEVLQVYADGQDLTSLQVGQKLAISKQTVDKHNQSILMEARNQFPKNFGSAKEVAQFLHGEKII